MISLVVCSIRPDQLERLKASVDATIGVLHEWLVSDNRNTGKGICAVYNELAAQAQYPFILFIHEDVTFDRAGWGNDILSVFERDEQLGLVGVAGSRVKSRSLSGWFTADGKLDRYQLTHTNGLERQVLDQLPNEAKGPHRVVCLDGVFLFCRRSVWQSVRFDEQHIRGFHFYDLDFSLRVHERYAVAVVENVGLFHHTASGGDYGSIWVGAAFDFHARWASRLPVQLSGAAFSETFIRRVWLDRLKDQSIRFDYRLKWILSQRMLVVPSLYYAVIKFLCYHPLRLRYLHRYLRKLFRSL